jgi:hypothetical protein
MHEKYQKSAFNALDNSGCRVYVDQVAGKGAEGANPARSDHYRIHVQPERET